jgi:hypothetical protein
MNHLPDDDDDADDDRLDTLLEKWAHAQSADKMTLDQLHSRICRRSAMPMAAPKQVRRPARGIVAVCVVATSLIVAAVAGFTTSNTPSDLTPVANRNRAESGSKLSALWNEAGRLFGSDLEWICDLDGELLLGINSDNSTSTATETICVLLTVRTFDPATRTWADSWSGRIACPIGLTVDFASADAETIGSIWVQSGPDGKFATSHWLNWNNHPELSGQIEATVAADEPQVIADRVADGRRVQVVQRVWHPDLG